MDMRLIKFCNSAHNVVTGGPTIQLGTLEYYRTLDPSFSIRDPGEGTHQLSFREGMSATLTDELSERALGGAVRGGGAPLEMIAKKGAFFRTQLHNCYVFCVTWFSATGPLPSLGDARAFGPSYDSMYEIMERDRFKRVLADALTEVITIAHLAPASRAAVSSLPVKELNINVFVIDREVEYVKSRDKLIETEDDLKKVEPYPKALEHALFTKEIRDSDQREYRFAFILSHPRLKMLSVNPDPIRIPVSRFASVCQPYRP